jgi:hypothetical protein
MSYAAHHKDFGSLVPNQVPEKAAAVAKKPGVLRRIFDAFMQTRQRDVDRQVARFLAARSGGTLTDSLERPSRSAARAKAKRPASTRLPRR